MKLTQLHYFVTVCRYGSIARAVDILHISQPSISAAIRELEKIEMIRQADGVYRLDHAVTATQKLILKAFGIDANYIKRKAKEISDCLNPKVHKMKI